MTVPAQSVTLLVIQSSGPSIMSVSPNKVGAGSAAFTMPVTGSQFVSGASVVWNGEKLATTFVSSSRLNASVPASAVSTPGSASIMVVQSSMKSNVVSLPIANVGPPVTSWMLTSSAMGSDGWCKAPARVTISATDPEGPANVASILYQVDRGLLTKYTGPFTVIGEGIHTVTGKSTDEIGNVGPLWTFTIKIDRTAPVTTLTSNAGTITLAAVDSLSGIASTTYSIDGASMQTYKGPFTIKGASGHAITYRSTNRAGIVEAQKRSVVFVLQPKPIITQVAEAPRVSN